MKGKEEGAAHKDPLSMSLQIACIPIEALYLTGSLWLYIYLSASLFLQPFPALLWVW